MPSGQYKKSRGFPSSKMKQQHEHVKEIAIEIKV